ncbi:MAG: hypothetical protein K2J11_12355 [Oscillospiraceae bacterium]|nr:hypothetical protein [Oscillospiraceae bacterium]
MCISNLIHKWSSLAPTAKIVIVTDDVQKNIALAIQDEGMYDVRIKYYSQTDEFAATVRSLSSLKESDLLLVMLSADTFVKDGANRFFSPFGKPEGVQAKYIFVRLDISQKSLVHGLSTEKKDVYDKIDQMNRINIEETVRVTNKSGTDISFKIKPFATCSHEITEDGGMAFLPPSETSSEVIAETANGKIVIDITVGQLYHFGQLVGYFGLVKSPITLLVENGIITEIFGDDMASEFKEKLFGLPGDCRRIVELGQGLSDMEPTGLIGVDESIIDSCHFGFGDGGNCGTHLDVVISKPTIEQTAVKQ